MTFGIAIAASTPLQFCFAQSDIEAPKFRLRTDANAASDLRALREALNRATDSDGPINPLGNFLQRNSASAHPEQSAAPKQGENEKGLDREAEQKPRIELRGGKNSDATDAAPPTAKAKETGSIGVLPGPHYFIVQQASPRYSDRVVDNFLPAPQYPVSLASASIPVRGSSNVVTANFQEMPGTGAYSSGAILPGGGLPGGVPGGFPNGIPIQTQPQFDGTTQPVLPFNNPPLPVSPGTMPGNPGVFPGGNVAPVNPPINPGLANPIPGYTNPGIANPVNPPIYTQPPNYGPQYGAPGRSSSDVMPSYPQPTNMVNGLPFVSGPPCQFDARYMVSQNAYRQAADCCAPSRGCGTGYATQPGGSPFAYVPPTYMPYNNNGYDSGFRPLIGFGQSLNNAYLGRGIVGQPVAYVDGQPVRNFIRYLFP